MLMLLKNKIQQQKTLGSHKSMTDQSLTEIICSSHISKKEKFVQVRRWSY